jgi:hypothetical protein
MDNIPVFRKSIKTLYGWDISPEEPLPYGSLSPWINELGLLTGFLQIARSYCLRYAAGHTFNQSGSYCCLDPLYTKKY